MNDSLLTSLFPINENQIPADYHIEPIHQREYLLNGEMRQWDGPVSEVYSPVCLPDAQGTLQRKLVGSFPVTGPKEALEALDAAVMAYDNGRGEWPQMSTADRIGCMETFVGKMLTQRKLVINLIMWEIGKNLADATKEFDRTVKYIYDTIDTLKNMDRNSSRFRMEEGIIGQIRRSPLGVVLAMGPFNYPLNETYTTLIPAILMGNTILFKTPKHGSLLHYPLLEAFRTSFPKGVVNSLYGRGANVVPPVMQSGKVNVLTLIGSSRVADELQRLHPKLNRLRSIMSLDAKNAAIILPDADLKVAVQECLLGSLSFNGQRCTAIKIIWAHRSIVDKFLALFCPEVSKLKPGMPWDTGVQITPLPEPTKTTYLTDIIANAEAQGASIVNEGGGTTQASLFKPAVVYPVKEGMRLYREEQFGPVIPVVVYDDTEEFIEYLITDDHGMQASLFGTDTTKIAELIDPLVNLVSRVNINAQCQRGPDTFPFTGRKDSAEGTLSVEDALRSFSIRSAVATKDTTDNKAILNEIVREHKSEFLSTNFYFLVYHHGQAIPGPNTLLTATRLSKTFPGNIKAVRNVSITLRPGQIVALVGASGSGKSTLLNLLAGLADADAGDVWFNEERVLWPSEKLVPGHEAIRLVHQEYQLMPNVSVRDNIAYALRFFEKNYRDFRVNELLKLCRLTEVQDRLPRQVSGGEKQRTAIARAIADKPAVLLLDEPFSHLDLPNRLLVRDLLFDLVRHQSGGETPTSCLFVTHDTTDALSIADTLGILRDGKMIQIGSPVDLYHRPATAYAARMTGPVTISKAKYLPLFGLPAADNPDALICLRPEQISLSDAGAPGIVRAVYFRGSNFELDVALSRYISVRLLTNRDDLQVGQPVHVTLVNGPFWYLKG